MGAYLSRTLREARSGSLKALIKVWLVSHFLFKVAYTLKRMRRTAKALKGIPGPKMDLVMKDFANNAPRMHDWRKSHLEKNNWAPLVKTANVDGEVMCTSPEAVKTILKTQFHKVTKLSPREDFIWQVLDEFLGTNGIFVMRHGDLLPKENEDWYAQRKTASKIFTKSNFSNMMFDTIVKKSDVVLDEVEKLIIRNENSNELETMDIQGKFFSFTFSAIQKIFFNRDTDDSIRGKVDEYQDAYDDTHRAGMAQVIHDSPALFVTTKLLPFPFGSLHPGDFTSLNPGFGFYRRFVTGHYYEFHKHREILHRHTDDIVAQARREAGTSKDRKDLLAYFLQSNVQHTDRQLRDIILNFIIAGRDTTACTLTWFMYEMTQNPQVQDKLAEEVRKTFGKDRLPALEDLEAENMPYMNACMLETLRLHPPVPEDQKVSLEPIEFPDGTVLPAGIKLNFSAYCMGRDPRRYPEPYKFKPERWTEGDIIARPNSEAMFEFPVFQAGNRYCIGMNLAKNETKLMMSRLLQKYSFELDPNQNPAEITFALMATMSLRNDLNPVEPKYELNVVPTRRP